MTQVTQAIPGTTSLSIEHRRVAILGKVQGVYYRATMVAEARRLGITGWVRNRMDGSVEARLSGPAEQVAALLAWARHGPPDAHVAELKVEIAEPVEAGGFEQRPTC